MRRSVAPPKTGGGAARGRVGTRLLRRRECSADWQSAVSQVGNLRSVDLPTASRRNSRQTVCATMAGLRPSLFDRRQNFCYDLGLRLRAVVSFAMQAQRDVAGFHVATTNHQHRVDFRFFGVLDLAV